MRIPVQRFPDIDCWTRASLSEGQPLMNTKCLLYQGIQDYKEVRIELMPHIGFNVLPVWSLNTETTASCDGMTQS